jgi:hypothetical protein
LSEVKVKEGIIIGPGIREVIEDQEIHSTLQDTENATWKTLKSVN